jgi:hypothetical protein
MAATVEESTPPDMATAMVFKFSIRASAALPRASRLKAALPDD